MNRSFRPPLWATLGTAAGCSLLAAAGFWQMSRGTQKQALLSAYDQAEHAAPLNLTAAASASPGSAPRAAQAHGSYLADRQLLLDGQEHAGVAGFEVWTPLRLDDGALLLVNRGWIAPGVSRQQLPDLPAPAGVREVSGLWHALPRPALRLGAGECAASAAGVAMTWPRIVEYPTVEELRCLYGEPVLAGELLLAPEVSDGFVRDWRAAPAEFPPSRHYAYALQWFAFAATLAGLFVRLNLKRLP